MEFSLAEFCQIPPNRLRKALSTEVIEVHSVIWPATFGWTTVLLSAPANHALHYGGVPRAKFLAQADKWLASTVETPTNLKKISKHIVTSKLHGSPSLQFLGLPFSKFHKPSSDNDLIQDRVHSFLIPSNQGTEFVEVLDRYYRQFSTVLVFPCLEDDYLYAQYAPTGKEKALVDPLRIHYRDLSTQAMLNWLRDVETLISMLRVDVQHGATIRSMFEPWIQRHGIFSFQPMTFSLGERFAGCKTLHENILLNRAMLLAELNSPIFHARAKLALEQSSAFASAGVRLTRSHRNCLERIVDQAERYFVGW